MPSFVRLTFLLLLSGQSSPGVNISFSLNHSRMYVSISSGNTSLDPRELLMSTVTKVTSWFGLARCHDRSFSRYEANGGPRPPVCVTVKYPSDLPLVPSEWRQMSYSRPRQPALPKSLG